MKFLFNDSDQHIGGHGGKLVLSVRNPNVLPDAGCLKRMHQR